VCAVSHFHQTLTHTIPLIFLTEYRLIIPFSKEKITLQIMINNLSAEWYKGKLLLHENVAQERPLGGRTLAFPPKETNSQTEQNK